MVTLTIPSLLPRLLPAHFVLGGKRAWAEDLHRVPFLVGKLVAEPLLRWVVQLMQHRLGPFVHITNSSLHGRRVAPDDECGCWGPKRGATCSFGCRGCPRVTLLGADLRQQAGILAESAVRFAAKYEMQPLRQPGDSCTHLGVSTLRRNKSNSFAWWERGPCFSCREADTHPMRPVDGP